MDLQICREIAIEHLKKNGKYLKFLWIGPKRKLRCQWLDPENGVFRILGTPGFIDMRCKELKIVTEMEYCEIEK
jgi:hypothetical protein